MKATHLTDEEIQQYVLDRESGSTIVNGHILNCEQCKERAEAYRLLMTSLHDQPRESFDFSLTELVMQQLPAAAPAARLEKENILIYAFIAAGASIIGFTLYFFRKFVARIFESSAPVFIYLVLTAFVTLSIFLVADTYRRYKKKIHIVEHTGFN